MPQDELAQYAVKKGSAPASDLAQYAKKPISEPPNQNLGVEPALNSYADATMYGLKELGGGIADAAKGLWGLVKPPSEDEIRSNPLSLLPPNLIAQRMGRGLIGLGKQAAEVPAAIHDLKQSADPWGHIAMAAPRAAGQGVGQIALATAPEVLPKIIPPIVRGTAKGTNAVLAKAPEMVGAGAGTLIGRELGSPTLGGGIGYAIGRTILPNLRMPGEEFGLTKASPTPEQINPSLISPSRTLPGQIPPERIGEMPGIPGTTARPSLERIMPPRPGLLLKGDVYQDPILAKLREYAAKIQEQGHGDEVPEQEETKPNELNLNEDLTPALKKSIRAVKTAKRSATGK